MACARPPDTVRIVSYTRRFVRVLADDRTVGLRERLAGQEASRGRARGPGILVPAYDIDAVRGRLELARGRHRRRRTFALAYILLRAE